MKTLKIGILLIFIFHFCACTGVQFSDFKNNDYYIDCIWKLKKIEKQYHDGIKKYKVILHIYYEIKNKTSSDFWFYDMAHGHDWDTMKIFSENGEIFINYGIVRDINLLGGSLGAYNPVIPKCYKVGPGNIISGNLELIFFINEHEVDAYNFNFFILDCDITGMRDMIEMSNVIENRFREYWVKFSSRSVMSTN